jgi:hypothetical protein
LRPPKIKAYPKVSGAPYHGVRNYGDNMTKTLLSLPNLLAAATAAFAALPILVISAQVTRQDNVVLVHGNIAFRHLLP